MLPTSIFEPVIETNGRGSSGIKFRRRTSTGSIPNFSATISTQRSIVKIPCG